MYQKNLWGVLAPFGWAGFGYILRQNGVIFGTQSGIFWYAPQNFARGGGWYLSAGGGGGFGYILQRNGGFLVNNQGFSGVHDKHNNKPKRMQWPALNSLMKPIFLQWVSGKY